MPVPPAARCTSRACLSISSGDDMTASMRRPLSLSFGRRGRATSRKQSAADLVSTALMQAAAEEFTGELRVSMSQPAGTAHLYLLDGALYSLLLEGYPADPIARLVTGGHLAPSDAAVIGQCDDPESVGVERGLFSIDAVAAVHAELLLAAVGAVIAGSAASLERHPGVVTSRLCSIPVAVSDVLTAVPVRAERLDSTWALVSTTAGPDRLVLDHVDPEVELPSQLPESRALASALDGQRTLDAVAASLGFTRAEAVHLAASLVAVGATHVVADAGQDPQGQALRSVLLVPEAFGQTPLLTRGHADVQDTTMPPGQAESGIDRETVRQLERDLGEARRALHDASERVASIEQALRVARGADRDGHP